MDSYNHSIAFLAWREWTVKAVNTWNVPSFLYSISTEVSIKFSITCKQNEHISSSVNVSYLGLIGKFKKGFPKGQIFDLVEDGICALKDQISSNVKYNK